MSSRPSVTIDAGVLAVPCETCSVEDVHKYIDTLLDWDGLLDEPWVAIYMSERASESLFADGLYPLHEQLKSLFNTHGIIEYDVNTVVKITNRLLAITPSFEAYYKLKDVLADPLLTDPDIITSISYNKLQADLARCVTLIAILRKHCNQPIGGHSFIIREAPEHVIKVRTQIHVIDHERDDIPSLPSPPEFFDGEVLVCDDFRGLVECIDETAIFTDSTDKFGIEISIKIAWFKDSLAEGENPDWGSATIPAIGKEFLSTCRGCCMDQSDSLPPKILRAITETMKNKNLLAVHALRTGHGGNDPQRMRGNDKAQRRDIDREFHLHYWECSDGTIELASVVYHNNFSIPE